MDTVTNEKLGELIRGFLLEKLSEEDQQLLWEYVMSHDVTDILNYTEDLLIEDYLEGSLSGDELESFKKIYLTSHSTLERVGMIRLLKGYAKGKKQE